MGPKAWMVMTATLQALCGLALLFAPEEVLRWFGSGGREGFLAQLFGAALLGFASQNWIAREALLGGIYGRAVVVGNATFLFVSAMIALSHALQAPGSALRWVAFGLLALPATGFVRLMFGSPPEVAAPRH